MELYQIKIPLNLLQALHWRPLNQEEEVVH